MVTETLVEPFIGSGREVIDQCRADDFTVVAAFWLKTFENENWYLYLVINTMKQEGPRMSYGKLYASWQKLTTPFVSYSDIKLIDASDPPAQAVQQLMSQYAGRLDTWFGPKLLGPLTAEKLFVYAIDR
jgi:hypothetical protein